MPPSKTLNRKKILRSRTGCKNCKRIKIKCDELKPVCSYCSKNNIKCDYSLTLTWGGRPYKDQSKRKNYSSPAPQQTAPTGAISFVVDDHTKKVMTPALDDSDRKRRHLVESLPHKRVPSSPVFMTPGGQSILLMDIKREVDSFQLVEDREFADGLLSLLNAVDRITAHPDMSPINTFAGEVFDPVSQYDYSEDLAKIETFMPERPSNFMEAMSPMPWFSPRRRLDDDDEITPLDSDLVVTVPTPELVDLTIPPAFTPLPELLLNVPLYRSLMHFWVNVASSNLVPAPSHIYQDNPFKVLLPQMAMTYPSILTTLLAFAAKTRMSLLDNNNQYIPQEIADHLLGRSCLELLKALKDKDEATSDGTLATVLLLSSYEAFNSESFERHRAHTIGARQIIMARRETLGLNTTEGKGKFDESNIAFFLMRWFAYVEVVGSLSSTKESHKYLPQYGFLSPGQLDFTDNKSTDPKRDIDYLLGFDVRFFPHMADITFLIRKANHYLESHAGDTIPVSLVTEALEVKERITASYQEGEARRQKQLDQIIDDKVQLKRRELGKDTTSPPNVSNIIAQDNVLRCTNKIFYDTAILNLYRRVLQVPRESLLIQDIANGIADVLQGNIESCSSAEICTIFCLFCAGCETMDNERRDFFLDRFTRLTALGNGNAKKSIRIMSRCWSTGEDWVTASRRLDIDITLL